MEFNIEKVFERDVDLYIINKFLNDKNFKKLFLDKIKCSNYEICNCIHSFEDENGESDITIILENDKRKIGLLIEDKINAIAMPNQYERYRIRGNRLIKEGLFEKYYIFIIAPNEYIKANFEAQKYDNKISYEELLDFISGDIYGESLISQAIAEKKKGYNVIENKSVTEFWKKYYSFIRKNYSQISFNEINVPRGSKAKWIEFPTDYSQVKIVHKTDRGCIDLTFSGMANHIDIFTKYTKDIINHGCVIAKAGKSLVIRKKVPIIDVKDNFDSYIEEMHESINRVKELYSLLERINVLMMYDEI